MHNPVIKLAHNKDIALKVYNQQVKKLNKNPKDKADVIESEARLQSLGYVEYVKNLSTKQQEMLRTNKIQNYIPSRAAWNGNSVSTPCRVVYDTSQPTPSGISSNDILAKLVYHGEKIGRYVRNYLHDSMVAQLFIHYATATCELIGY